MTNGVGPKLAEEEVNLKDIILRKTDGKREAYWEIIKDYPDTKRSVNIAAPAEE